jgi:hypothetical protein
MDVNDDAIQKREKRFKKKALGIFASPRLVFPPANINGIPGLRLVGVMMGVRVFTLGVLALALSSSAVDAAASVRGLQAQLRREASSGALLQKRAGATLSKVCGVISCANMQSGSPCFNFMQYIYVPACVNCGGRAALHGAAPDVNTAKSANGFRASRKPLKINDRLC